MSSRNNRSAQQIIEYLLLFSVVVLAVLAFVVNQGYFRGSVYNVINESIYAVDVDADLWTYRWVETGCVCSNSCGAGTFNCTGLACHREDGLIVPDQICIDLGLPLPMTGTSCVGQNCCGNGDIDTQVGEECDGGFLGGASCSDYGYYPTQTGLACTAICTIDPSGCNRCGDGVLYADAGLEPCEPPPLEQFQGQDCVSEVGPGSSGTLSCNFNCTINTDGCYDCGDGIKNGSAEECDGTDWGMVGQCSDIPNNPPYWDDDGTLLSCKANCKFNKSKCLRCGDGALNGPEECDSSIGSTRKDWIENSNCYNCWDLYSSKCGGSNGSDSCYGYPGCSPGGGPGGNLCNDGRVRCWPRWDPLRRCTCRYVGGSQRCHYDPKSCINGVPPLPSDPRYKWCYDPESYTGLMQNTSITTVDTCTAGAKCEKTCKPPFVYDAGVCACPSTFEEDGLGNCQCPARSIMKGVGACGADACYRDVCTASPDYECRKRHP